MQTKPPGFMTISQAAEMLNKSKRFVKHAITAGLLTSSTVPYKSNLRPGVLATAVFVKSDDIRDVMTGKIDLDVLADVKQVTRKSAPTDMSEFTDRFGDLERTVEQLAVMAATILERLETAATPKKPKAPLHGI